MDYSLAQKAVAEAIKKAEELGIFISVAVVDVYGDLVAFGRMKGAIKISPDFAISKAYTSGTIGMATSDIAGYAVEGKPYFGLNSLFGGKLTTISGGVGGSTDVNQDLECAKTALSVFS